jgi:hypothetical protein
VKHSSGIGVIGGLRNAVVEQIGGYPEIWLKLSKFSKSEKGLGDGGKVGGQLSSVLSCGILIAT